MVFSGHCEGNNRVVWVISTGHEQFKQYDEFKLLDLLY